MHRISLNHGGTAALSASLLLGLTLQAGQLSSSVGRPADFGSQVEAIDLPVFSRVAYIPATTDPGTIRLENVRATTVPTRLRATTDPTYCEELKFRDPGGSMYCPYTETAARERAYEVTFAYSGVALGSDEYQNTHFTFRVYFRTDELPRAVRDAVILGRPGRSALAIHFKVNISRQLVARSGIDPERSVFCPVHLVAGYIRPVHPTCQDQLQFRSEWGLSDYWTVQVSVA